MPKIKEIHFSHFVISSCDILPCYTITQFFFKKSFFTIKPVKSCIEITRETLFKFSTKSELGEIEPIDIYLLCKGKEGIAAFFYPDNINSQQISISFKKTDELEHFCKNIPTNIGFKKIEIYIEEMLFAYERGTYKKKDVPIIKNVFLSKYKITSISIQQYVIKQILIQQHIPTIELVDFSRYNVGKSTKETIKSQVLLQCTRQTAIVCFRSKNIYGNFIKISVKPDMVESDISKIIDQKLSSFVCPCDIKIKITLTKRFLEYDIFGTIINKKTAEIVQYYEYSIPENPVKKIKEHQYVLPQVYDNITDEDYLQGMGVSSEFRQEKLLEAFYEMCADETLIEDNGRVRYAKEKNLTGSQIEFIKSHSTIFGTNNGTVKFNAVLEHSLTEESALTLV